MELTTGDRTGTDNLLYVASAILPLHVTWCGSACLGSFGLELLYSGLSPSPGLGLGPDPDKLIKRERKVVGSGQETIFIGQNARS